MRPLRILIPGSYWDSQIYSGRLYLFELGGDVRTVNWDAIISTWPIERSLRLGLLAGFLRSDFLYGHELFALFQDPEVRSLVEAKFAALSTRSLEIPSTALEKHTLGQQASPFPFPHSDSEIYLNRMYVGGPSGLWSTSCKGQTKHPLSTRVQRRFDGPLLSISASYSTIAAAAGEDGLFEFPIHRWGAGFEDREDRQTAGRPCEDCNWTYYSIYASSRIGSGFLVEYSKTEHEQFWKRDFTGVTPASDLFEKPGYTWGVQDKLCCASNGFVDVVRYRPWMEKPNQRLEPLGRVSSLRSGQDAIAASAAPFGAVVEYSNSMVVYLSDGTSNEFSGEPVSWRVFPRSKHYENQLHIQYTDHMEIVSFNHDYIIDQSAKIVGTTVHLGSSRAADPLLRLMKQPE